MSNAVISRADVLQAAQSIEPLPASVSRLMAAMSDPDLDAATITEIVQHDPVLTGDVLARANSAVSGALNHIGDVRQATARLGTTTIVEIALRRAMRTRLAAPLEAYRTNADQLWRHSVTASVAAELIRRRATKPIPPMVSTAALLHDIGKVVIATSLPLAMSDALAAAAGNDEIDIAEAERRVLGIDHGEAGAVVVRGWGLPVGAQTALMQHHADHDEHDLLTHALVLADLVAHAVDRLPEPTGDATDDGDEADTGVLVPGGDPHADACGIARTDLVTLVIDTADQAVEVLSRYN